MATLVVAIAKNYVIGLNNKMPWHLPEDLQHFKKTTLGHTLIMGRKTFESIGKPLPGRRTIVLTRDANWRYDGCETAQSISRALELAKSTPEKHPFIVGGANVYEQALHDGLIDKMIVTKIDITPDGDAFFPIIDESHWAQTGSEQFESKTGLRYSIVQFEPKAKKLAS
jgi:dihydrofolate reductase